MFQIIFTKVLRHVYLIYSNKNLSTLKASNQPCNPPIHPKTIVRSIMILFTLAIYIYLLNYLLQYTQIKMYNYNKYVFNKKNLKVNLDYRCLLLPTKNILHRHYTQYICKNNAIGVRMTRVFSILSRHLYQEQTSNNHSTQLSQRGD